MAKTTLKRRHALLLVLSLPLAFLTLFSYSEPPPLLASLRPLVSASSPPSSWISNYHDGSWQPLPSPITNLSSLEALYPGYFFHDGVCGGGLDRLYKIASWDWFGRDGSTLDWNGRQFVVDALKRQGGVILVGDSITVMHYAGISRLLEGLSFTYRTEFKTNEKLTTNFIVEEVVGNPLHSVLRLNPQHPALAGLLEDAGVGQERMEVPLVSMLRNDFLATNREVLDDACEENGAEFNWDARGIFLYDWLTTVQDYTSRPSPHKTLLILNTGMHFGVPPFKDRNAPLETVLGVVDSIIQRTYTSIATHLPHVQVIVRTSYPGETDCEKATEPFQDVSQASPTSYGWNRVPLFNALLRTHLPLLSSSPPPSLLDVERQGTLRADARLKPAGGTDCLHVCATGISESWGRWVGEVMHAKSS